MDNKALQSKNRYDYIDALRGIAIALVFVVHAGGRANVEGAFRKVISSGQYGVQLFFVISAFTIFLTLDRRKGKEEGLITNFFIRRLFRILPVYWFGIVFYTVLYGLGSRSLLPGPEVWHFLPNFLLVNLLHPETMSSVVPGGWSISCEVLFYCVVPLLFPIITTYKRALYFIMLTVVLFPVMSKVISVILASQFSLYDSDLVRLYWYRFPLNQLGAFAFGFLLFYLVREGRCWEFLSDKCLNFSLLVSLILMCVLLSLSQIPFPPRHLFYSGCFCIIAMLLSVIPWAVVVNRATIFLGRISYSCYLLHFFVLKEVMAYLTVNGIEIGNQYMRFTVIFTLTLVLTVPLGYMSYRIIELPASAVGRFLISYRAKVKAGRAESSIHA